jgi:arylsulfatase A-like enzyme
MLRNGKVESIVKNLDDVQEFARIFTEEAVGFIRKNKDKPFFVYLPHPFVNSPRIARQEFYPEGWVPAQTAGNGHPNAKASIEEVDWSTGQILDTLRELGLDKNTLVIFTSDNGGGHCHVNEPLRGRERGEWEGCHRVATLAWWPGQVPKNSTCDEVLTAMDLLPTFASIAGGKLPNDRVMDGKDISPVLLGKEGAKSPHNTYYYYLVGKLAAVRSGEWKLHKNGVLYNLNTNIKEGGRGQAGKNPEVVARLKKMMADFGAEMKDPAKVRKAAYVEKPQFLTKPAKEK